MASFQLSTPVGLIIFNRPDTTRRVFEAIRRAKPPTLLIAADGPRDSVPGDAERCAAARAIVSEVDWRCEVLTRFSDENLGCGRGPATGITWMFEQVEEVIILEDDCLPGPDFFRFCQDNLEKYRYDTRIMLICGTNVLGEWKSDVQSYHYSIYGGIWGWASWRRAWKHFDYDMALWGHKEVRDRVRDVMGERCFAERQGIYARTSRGDGVSWWDYQWGFARLSQSGLAVVPSRNLISNIGCGADATHARTDAVSREFGNRPVFELTFPLTHSASVIPDKEYDARMFEKLSMGGTIWRRVPRWLLRGARRAFRREEP